MPTPGRVAGSEMQSAGRRPARGGVRVGTPALGARAGRAAVLGARRAGGQPLPELREHRAGLGGGVGWWLPTVRAGVPAGGPPVSVARRRVRRRGRPVVRGEPTGRGPPRRRPRRAAGSPGAPGPVRTTSQGTATVTTTRVTATTVAMVATSSTSAQQSSRPRAIRAAPVSRSGWCAGAWVGSVGRANSRGTAEPRLRRGPVRRASGERGRPWVRRPHRNHQPRARHSGTPGRSAPRVVSSPWPG